MKTENSSKGGIQVSAFLVILCCLAVTFTIFFFVFGSAHNFEKNDTANHPLNIMGTIYKGGIIVPIIQGLLLTVVVLSVERFFALTRANGKGNLTKFVQNIRLNLQEGNVERAKELCHEQKGSVANVVESALGKYKEMEANSELSKEQKLLTIQKEIEEATALEMPGLEQNLAVVATMTTLGTLLGLLGTVVGMIRAFAAMATAGAPDSIALSTGISEALINTAFGIGTGALAVISYNYFTSKIDRITYVIDEVGFTIVQSYSTSHK